MCMFWQFNELLSPDTSLCQKEKMSFFQEGTSAERIFATRKIEKFK